MIYISCTGQTGKQIGKLGYTHQEENDFIDIKTQLEVLADNIKDGKIRYIGLSNETPWGLMKFLSVADKYNLPG